MTKPRLLTQPGFSFGSFVPEATILTEWDDVAIIGSRCLPASDRPGMSMPQETPLRQRLCNSPDCRRLFFLCSRCDRGQRYCSPPCREQTRREQLRAANRRNQRTPEGRLNNRDRQQAFRRRKALVLSQAPEKNVTDQSSKAPLNSGKITSPPLLAPATPMWRRLVSDFGQAVCRFCGRVGRLINPFYASD